MLNNFLNFTSDLAQNRVYINYKTVLSYSVYLTENTDSFNYEEQSRTAFINLLTLFHVNYPLIYSILKKTEYFW